MANLGSILVRLAGEYSLISTIPERKPVRIRIETSHGSILDYIHKIILLLWRRASLGIRRNGSWKTPIGGGIER